MHGSRIEPGAEATGSSPGRFARRSRRSRSGLDPAAAENVVEAYAERFAAGMLDLSCPSPPPSLVIDAAALARADLGYAPPGGTDALRARIAARYRSLGAEDVLVTNGASEALAALALVLGGAGRRVAVHAGAFPSFAETARATGTELVDAGDAGEASDAAVRCDAVLLTNPVVPSGRRVDVARVVREALAAGAVPVVDEVYRELALDGRPAPAAADLDARAVSVGDLSKPLGLGGLRIGWVATRDAGLRAGVARWLRLLGAGPSVLSQEGALAAFDGFDAYVDDQVGRAAAAAPAVYRELDRAGWRFAPAEAGLTVLAAPPAPIDDDALDALRREGRFLLRADSFGAPGAFRVALLADPRELRHALARLRELAAGPAARRRGGATRTAGGAIDGEVAPAAPGDGTRGDAGADPVAVDRHPADGDAGNGAAAGDALIGDAANRDATPGPAAREGAPDIAATEGAAATSAADALVVLMRAPRPGFGKTRLAAGVGVDAAGRLARAFVADTLALATAGPWRPLVAFTPPEAAAEVAALAPGATLAPQVDGDLGARIRGALDAALRAAHDGPAVLIGSDTPDLDPALVARAFTALRGGADIVLGPADDGGFYLAGVRRTHPRMFDGVEWSTRRVFDQALAAAARLGWSLAVLPPWGDVDDATSLAALAARLAASSRAPATRDVLAALAPRRGAAARPDVRARAATGRSGRR